MGDFSVDDDIFSSVSKDTFVQVILVPGKNCTSFKIQTDFVPQTAPIQIQFIS